MKITKQRLKNNIKAYLIFIKISIAILKIDKLIYSIIIFLNLLLIKNEKKNQMLNINIFNNKMIKALIFYLFQKYYALIDLS